MALLIIGLTIWCLVHITPALFIDCRTLLIDKFTAKGYRVIAALLLVTSIIFIVMGWRSIEPITIYTPSAWGYQLAPATMFISLLLFVASSIPSNLNRLLRHPQLTAVIFWGIAHILANGDNRSIILFGVIGLWALVEIILINRRDGSWEKPTKKPVSADLKLAVVTVIVYGIAWFAHPYLSGINLL